MAGPVDLHPDIVKAIRGLADTSLGRKYDTWSRKRYGVAGTTLAAKTVAGEFGGRSTRSGAGVVSSAGARGPAQFIPSTRSAYQKQYSIDPWADDKQAIEGMVRHHLSTGVEGYNPGMPTYKDYILGQKIDAADRKALRAGRPSAPAGDLGSPPKTQVGLEKYTIPGQSFEPERQAARRQLLLGGDLNLNRLLQYKSSISSLQDVPERQVAGDITVQRTPGQAPKAAGGDIPLGGGEAKGGTFNITGPNPKRLKPELTTFARKVARIYGKPLTGSDGATHSKYTVNGNVSEHYTGNATDIPAAGAELLRMGRSALIAAGMPRAQALKAKGGLYNVGGHQIIFLTNEGGNHHDHLHISARGAAPHRH